MAASDHAARVADEQARNSRYIQRLREKCEQRIPIAVHASTNWTQSGMPRLRTSLIEAIIGRVGLVEQWDDIEGDSFYIGPTHVEIGDMKVYSWAAPVAHAFFGTDGYPTLDGRVQVTRAFRHRSTDIVDFDDDRVDGSRGPTAFDRVARLAVPRAPRSGARPPVAPVLERTTPASVPVPADAAPEKPERLAESADTGTGLRQERALRKALAAPRSEALGHVLATMQPAQYRLVTWPDDVPLVVQGFPGTGKTIVALHRAAYLVNPERDADSRPGRVVLLGPTTNFVRHTRRAVEALAESSAQTPSVEVLSIPDLLRRIYPRLSNDGAATSELYQDNARWLGQFVDATAKRVEAAGGLRGVQAEEGAQRIFAALRQIGGARTSRVHARWSDYLAALPEWALARRMPRFHSLVACCYLAAMPTLPSYFDHLVVDEAQDVTPLVWHMLRRLNRTGRWTVVGDMNQRSFDWSLPTWDDVVAAAGIDLAGRPVEEFRAAYRSTQGILAFANLLLPEQRRHVDAIQADPQPPAVQKYTAEELPGGIVAAVEDLHTRHPVGTIAVIATDDGTLRTTFARAGWRAQATGSDQWTRRDGATVRLLRAQDARGLEFDGVVVVEPGRFPKSDGSEGPLYTSLTRANRELVLVHSRGLPAPLRRAVTQAGRSAASR